MSQQDAAKEQANTRKNVRIVSVFTAAAAALPVAAAAIAASSAYANASRFFC